MSVLEIQGAERPKITFAEVRNILHYAFDKHGVAIADSWLDFNERFWEGKLEPVPLFLVAATPYGNWSGLCTHNKQRTINIQIKHGLDLQTKRGVLLHEMVHQYLVESGANIRHNGQPWCTEIMRISRDYFGKAIWAGAPKMARVKRRNPKTKEMEKVITRINPPGPNGEPSLTQKEIAGWPHSVSLQP